MSSARNHKLLGQSTLEYIMLVVAALVVLISLIGTTGTGPTRDKVEATLNATVEGIESVADSVPIVP